MKLLFTLAAFVLLFTADIAVAQNTQKGSSPDSKTSTNFSFDELEFPAVEGWTVGQKTALPGERSGFSVNYDSPDRERVTVYIYLRYEPAKDLKGIVKEEFDGALDALNTIAAAGVYKDLKIGKKETATVGGSLNALKASLSFSAQDTKFTSELYVFPYKGRVGKIRASRPVSVTKDEQYLKLLGALDKFLAK